MLRVRSKFAFALGDRISSKDEPFGLKANKAIAARISSTCTLVAGNVNHINQSTVLGLPLPPHCWLPPLLLLLPTAAALLLLLPL
jgi:hypothetical protein